MLLPYEKALKIYCSVMSLHNHLISHKVSTKTILNEDLLKMILEERDLGKKKLNLKTKLFMEE